MSGRDSSLVRHGFGAIGGSRLWLFFTCAFCLGFSYCFSATVPSGNFLSAHGYSDTGSVTISDSLGLPFAAPQSAVSSKVHYNPYVIALDGDPVVSQVVGRHVFYNNSVWDGSDPGPNLGDDAAIAEDKTALLPGGTGSFGNITSYALGLNGIMIDISNPARSDLIQLSDFDFEIGNTDGFADVAPAPPPTAMTVRHTSGSVWRITFVFADSAIQNTWLRTRASANANTGIALEDVFYFGNLIGEVGDDPVRALVDNTDVLRAFDNQTLEGAAEITYIYDFTRDATVDLDDVRAAFYNQTGVAGDPDLIQAQLDFATDLGFVPDAQLFQEYTPLVFVDTVPGGTAPDEQVRIAISRIAARDFFINLSQLDDSWTLQYKENLEEPAWSPVVGSPSQTGFGFGWIIEIHDSVTRIFLRGIKR